MALSHFLPYWSFMIYFKNMNINIIRKAIPVFVILPFLWMQTFSACLLKDSYAQVMPAMPQAGFLVNIGPQFSPVLIKGININLEDPFQLGFIIDKGDTDYDKDTLGQEASKLIKYFLASLTIPGNDLWVNLSPHEKDRIIPEGFSRTEMGRDLLAQDYLLKQVTASLLYPEEQLGQEFWERVNQKALDQYGTVDIDLSTFNKVWIVPEFAEIYEEGTTAMIIESRLKVLTEFDYLSEIHNQSENAVQQNREESISNEILREIIVPAIEQEVNFGESFAPLRQIYNSLILATWFKRNLKDSILSQVYVGQNKIEGVDIEDKNQKEMIYQKYLEAFKQGAFNYIKDEYDPVAQEVIPRKYFSGGALFNQKRMDDAVVEVSEEAKKDKVAEEINKDTSMLVNTVLVFAGRAKQENLLDLQDQSMLSEGFPEFKNIFENKEVLILEAVNSQDGDSRVHIIYDGKTAHVYIDGKRSGDIDFKDMGISSYDMVSELLIDSFDPLYDNFLHKKGMDYGNIVVAALANIAFQYDLLMGSSITGNTNFIKAYKRFLSLEGIEVSKNGLFYFSGVRVQEERLAEYEFDVFSARVEDVSVSGVEGERGKEIANAIVDDIYNVEHLVSSMGDKAMLSNLDEQRVEEFKRAVAAEDSLQFRELVRMFKKKLKGADIRRIFGNLVIFPASMVTSVINEFNISTSQAQFTIVAAIVQGKVEHVRNLVDYLQGDLVERFRYRNEDYLTMAVQENHPEIVQLLLNSGYFNRSGRARARYLAEQAGQKDTVALFKKFNLEKDKPRVKLARVAIRRRNGQKERVIAQDISTKKDSLILGNKDVGGIDLNSNNLDIKTVGEGIDWQIPEDFDMGIFENPSFTGLAPVIFEMVPISSFSMVLGN